MECLKIIFIMASLTAIKVITYNIAAKDNLGGLCDILVNEKPDIVLLQEVHVTTDELSSVLKNYNYETVVNNDSSDDKSRGTAMVWKVGVEVSNVNTLELARLQSVDFGPLTFFNVYAPSGQNNRSQRRDFFGRDLFMAARGLCQGNLPVIGGDFNCVMEEIDTESNFKNKNCPALQDFLATFNYSDAFRILHSDMVDFTFYRQGAAASRLDRFYVPPGLVKNVKSVFHKPALSDHKYGVMEFIVPDGAPPIVLPTVDGSTYWKLNTKVVTNDDFLPNFMDVWEVLIGKEGNYDDVADWWDSCAKPGLADFCKRFSSVISKGRKQTKRLLLSWLNVALSEKDWKSVTIIRGKLNKFLQEDSMGFIVRSKHKQVLEEERGSLYHANREKKHGIKGSFKKLKVKDINDKVTILSDKDEIHKEILGFFHPLFNGFHRAGPVGGEPVNSGATFIQDRQFLDKFLTGLGRLSPGSKADLEMPVELDGLLEVIKECEKEKSPGSDGLPYEFYQATAHVIGDKLVQVYQSILDKFQLTGSMEGGITRLLSKVLGIPAADELRPITLLCCDYKILTKYLTKRLIPVLPEVILSGQLASLKDSSIIFGVTNIFSSIEYVALKRIGAAIISYDMFKAFDRVMVKFLCQVMEAMGFGDTFIKWVAMCHANITTRFILDKLCDPIKLMFSIRQGDPWSMVLYILYIEPLLMCLGRELKGLKMASFDQVDEDFCDDVNIITENEEDFMIAEIIFRQFESVSGAILNRSKKTKVMGIGAWTGRQDWPIKWIKVVDELKIFGFFVTPFYERTIVRNWEDLVKKVAGVLISWKSRQLPSLRIRSDVIRIFATSKIWYFAQALPILPNFVKQIEQKIRQFLWMGQLETLPLDEMKNPPLAGGLGIPCVQSKCDALFIRQTTRILTSQSNSPYKHLKYWIGITLKKYFPDMAGGAHSPVVPKYFRHMNELMKEAIEDKVVKVESLECSNAKLIYQHLTSTIEPPKVILKFKELPFEAIWERMENPVIEGSAKNLLFKMINNIIPNRARLFRMNKALHPWCVSSTCLVRRMAMGPLAEGVRDRAAMWEEVGGVVEDITHQFCVCPRVAEVWAWLRGRIVEELFARGQAGCSDFELLHFSFPETQHDTTIVWMLSIYVEFIYNELVIHNRNITIDKLKAILAAKHLELITSKRPQINYLPFDIN